MKYEQLASKVLNIITKGRVTPRMTRAYVRLINIPPENIVQELKLFQKDLKIHGLGVLLWLKERYPSIVLIYSLLGLDLNWLNVRSDMNVVVEEYYAFIADIKKTISENELDEEIEKTSQLLFAGEVQPKNLSTKDLFINYLSARFIQNMKKLTPQIESYSEKIMNEMQILITKNPEKGLLNLVPLLFKIKKYKKSSLPTISKIGSDLKQIGEEFKSVFDENTAIAYLCLNLITSIDSFNVEFAKFLARLHNILTKGNGPVNHESYLQVKGYDPEIRIILKFFLENDLQVKYPHLSNYIRNIFNYNKYRIVSAHRNPKIRFNEGKAYFFRSGKSELEMDLNNILKEVKTYGYFIDSLHVFKRNDLEKNLFQRTFNLP